jgi:hypothetical protein
LNRVLLIFFFFAVQPKPSLHVELQTPPHMGCGSSKAATAVQPVNKWRTSPAGAATASFDCVDEKLSAQAADVRKADVRFAELLTAQAAAAAPPQAIAPGVVCGGPDAELQAHVELTRALVAEAGDLLQRLPSGEAEELLATLRYSSSVIAQRMKTELIAQQASISQREPQEHVELTRALVAEAGDLLQRLPSCEAAELLATLRCSSSVIAQRMKTELVTQQASISSPAGS